MTDDKVRVVKHPATFSRAILEKLDEIVPDGIYLDPFAGVGKIHRLERKGRKFIGIEIEPEWAAMDPRTVCADALQWMEHHAQYSGQRFDGVVTSPVYGNRMSDHHNPKDASKRHSYKFALGRDLTDGNSEAVRSKGVARCNGAHTWVQRGKSWTLGSGPLRVRREVCSRCEIMKQTTYDPEETNGNISESSSVGTDQRKHPDMDNEGDGG